MCHIFFIFFYTPCLWIAESSEPLVVIARWIAVTVVSSTALRWWVFSWFPFRGSYGSQAAWAGRVQQLACPDRMHGSDLIVAHRLLASPSAEKDDRNWAGLARGVVSGTQHRARFVVGFPVGVYSRVVVFLHVTKVAPRTMRCCTCAGDTGHDDSVRLPATSRRSVRVGYSSVPASGSGPPRSSFVSRCLGSSRPSAREVVLAGPRPTASCPGAAATRASSRVGWIPSVDTACGPKSRRMPFGACARLSSFGTRQWSFQWTEGGVMIGANRQWSFHSSF